MENFGTKLENVIIKSFTILRNNDSGSRLKFPTYRNGQRRVSEQELRFVFVEQLQDLLKEYDFFYSIETPTNGKYKFSENGKYVIPQVCKNGQSASFDLSITDKNGKMVAIIEFKAKNANPHDYAKDFCKLWNPEEKSCYKYFVNLFEKIENSTKKSFGGKITPERNKWIGEKKSSEKIIVMAQSLRENDPVIKKEI